MAGAKIIRSGEGGGNYSADKPKNLKESKSSYLSRELEVKLEAEKFWPKKILNRLNHNGEVRKWRVLDVDDVRGKVGIELIPKDQTEKPKKLTQNRRQLALEQVSLPWIAFAEKYWQEMAKDKSVLDSPEVINHFKREILLNTVIALLNKNPDLPRDPGPEVTIDTMLAVAKNVIKNSREHVPAAEVKPERMEMRSAPDIVEVVKDSIKVTDKTAQVVAENVAFTKVQIRASLSANGLTVDPADHDLRPDSEATFELSATESPQTIYANLADASQTLAQLPTVEADVPEIGQILSDVANSRSQRGEAVAGQIEAEATNLERAVKDLETVVPERRAILKAVLGRARQAFKEFGRLAGSTVEKSAQLKGRLLGAREKFETEKSEILAEAVAELPQNEFVMLTEEAAESLKAIDQLAPLAYEDRATDPYDDG